MSFTLPAFNLPVNIWRFLTGVTNPPDVVTAGNLALGRRIGQVQSSFSTSIFDSGAMWLLLPPGTDIRDAKTAGGPDVVEVGAGSGRFYDVVWVDDAGGGFANEHRFAEIIKQTTWPAPIPTPSSVLPPPPVVGPFSLMANGSNGGVTSSVTIPNTYSSSMKLAFVFYAGVAGGGLAIIGSLSGPHGPFTEIAMPQPGGSLAFLGVYDLSTVNPGDTLTFNSGVTDLIMWTTLQTTAGALPNSGVIQSAGMPMTNSMGAGTTFVNQPLMGIFVDVQSGNSAFTWSSPFATTSVMPDLFDVDAFGNFWGMSINSCLEPTVGINIYTVDDVGADGTGYVGFLFDAI